MYNIDGPERRCSLRAALPARARAVQLRSAQTAAQVYMYVYTVYRESANLSRNPLIPF